MKVGLMLGGGGARGAYQIGIFKAFDEHNLKNIFSCVSGTSIGALNGYFYLSSKNYVSVLNSWLYGIENNPIRFSKRLKGKDKHGFFSMDVVYEMEERFIEKGAIKEKETDLYVVSTKVTKPTITGLLPWKWEKEVRHVNTSEDPLKDAISSSSLPFVFGATEIENNYYLDGGLIDNNPIEILIEKGCTIIFYCSLDSNVDFEKYKDYNITIINLTSPNIFPKKSIKFYLQTIDFNESFVHKLVDFGYYVGKEMIKELIKVGLLKVKNQTLTLGKQESGFTLIDVPFYISADIQVMKENYEEEE